jgi:hypothetical protein
MSKLKKVMSTGTIVTVLFAAPITVLNQLTPVLSQSVQSAFIAKGSTPVGNTAWQQYFDGQGVFVDVDTSSAGAKTTPIYITSLGGRNAHWGTIGATSIYFPTPTGFRVYVQWSAGGALTPATANELGWHINWIAVLN